MDRQDLGHPRAYDFVHVPQIISLALSDVSRSQARMMICRGLVKVGAETIGLPDLYLTREKLRGKRIEVGKQSFEINEVGNGIRRTSDLRLRQSQP